MTLFRPLAALLLLALAGCATDGGARAAPSWYVMRHLQKAEGADPPLSDLGRRNAELLAGLLDETPPRAIYASATRRARETAQPTAARYRLTIKEYDPRDTPGLVARVRAENGPVLIVGHSNTVPAIIKALSGRDIGEMDESAYGTLFQVRSDGIVVRTRVDVNCDPLQGGEDRGARC
ncbi:MAG TPA: phosphoglycerate mutase family protein [Allosphingosinicella sp.]|jgi:phosphohistidine phosphatase SixA